MVRVAILFSLSTLWGLIPGAGIAFASVEDPGPDPAGAVGSALGKGAFPWYDPGKDAVRPIALPREPTPPPPKSPTSPASKGPGGPGLGDVFAMIGFGLALALLIGLLAWFWRIYEPTDSPEPPDSSKHRAGPSRVESLPAGLRGQFESSDPWEEAVRRRSRGDFEGAVICLFAHQLLTLSRLGLVRLSPGKTGRQLLRAVVDPEFRRLVGPTLRLFEVVYYGHRTPSSEEFALLWNEAEAFERRVAAGVAA